MTTNVGTADRVIRVVLAVVAAIVGFSVGAGSVLGIVLLVVAAVLLRVSMPAADREFDPEEMMLPTAELGMEP